MNIEVQIKLDQIIDIVKKEHFQPEYQSVVSDTDCLGVALSQYLNNRRKILDTTFTALEESNGHVENEVIHALLNERKKWFLVNVLRALESVKS